MAPALEGPSLRDALWLAAPAVGGLAVRLWGLGDQVLADDEIWAPMAASRFSVLELLTRFGHENYSLPLTALARWLSDLGVPMSELSLRAPSIVAGALLLVVVPLLVAREFGRVAGAAFAGLAAASPLLVTYARQSRPYLPALVLATIGVLAFVDGWARPRRAPFLVWAVLAVLACWLLPVVLPFVAAPPFAALVAALADRPRGSRARLRFVIDGGVVAATLFAAVFVPALRTFLDVVAPRLEDSAARAAGWQRTVLLLAGTPYRAAALALVLLAMAGASLAVQRLGARFGLFAAGAAAQLAAVVMLHPQGIAFPLILARYLLPLLVVGLLALALLAAALLQPLARRAPFTTAAAAALACALALVPLGPLRERLTRERALFGFDALSNFIELPGDSAEEPLPRPYQSAAIATAGVIAEAPYDLRSATVRPLRWLAMRHGKPLVLVATYPFTASPRVALRTVSTADPGAILASRADALVLHTRLRDEGDRTALLASRELRPHERKALVALDKVAAELGQRLTAVWGPPDSRSPGFAVWDLRRVRRQKPPASAR